MVIAAIMCGGRGSRMRSEEEKPMAALAGRSFVERVLAALEESGRFSRVVAAASPATPKTKAFLQSRGVEVVETPGGGYSSDLSFLLERLAPEQHQRQVVLVVPADLPLLSAKVVDEVVELLAQEKHAAAPAVSIVMEKNFVERLGISPSVIVDKNYCHSGVTLFSFAAGGMAASGGGEIEERYVVSNRIELAVNVNTKKEKELAGRLLLVERAQDLAGDEGL